MTLHDDADDDGEGQEDFENRVRQRFEGLSDEQFLTEVREIYSDGSGLPVAYYIELSLREEEGLDIASHDPDLARSFADEKASVAETMAELSEKFADFGTKLSDQVLSKFQLPTLEVPPSFLEGFTAAPISSGSKLATDFLSDREDLQAFLVPPDPNAGIVHLLEAQTEKLDVIERNTADAADALAYRLEQAEAQNRAFEKRLDAIEQNTTHTSDALVTRLEQAEAQTKNVKDQFVAMRNLALLSLIVAIVSVVLILILNT